jgi:hypothetical protein
VVVQATHGGVEVDGLVGGDDDEIDDGCAGDGHGRQVSPTGVRRTLEDAVSSM